MCYLHELHCFVASRTIAAMPALNAGGRLGHASTTAANLGSPGVIVLESLAVSLGGKSPPREPLRFHWLLRYGVRLPS